MITRHETMKLSEDSWTIEIRFDHLETWVYFEIKDKHAQVDSQGATSSAGIDIPDAKRLGQWLISAVENWERRNGCGR